MLLYECKKKQVITQIKNLCNIHKILEQGRRKPFDSTRIEKFCEVLHLSEEDRARMYDLAAREKSEIPADIEDTMMYSGIGDLARYALRMSNAGVADEEDWKKFIRELENKRGNKFD